MPAIDGVELGFLVGGIPTVAMLFASLALANIEVHPYVEACFQSFAAGLILAAVASELFPLMLGQASPVDTVIGVTVGFILALLMLYGVEKIVGWFEDFTAQNNMLGILHNDSIVIEEDAPKRTYPQGLDPNIDADTLGIGLLPRKNEESVENHNPMIVTRTSWEDAPVERASLAIALPSHRNHIRDQLRELATSVLYLHDKSEELLNKDLMPSASEETSEQIDREVHSLQYKLDHCRRLLQGSESDAGRQYSEGHWSSKTFNEERRSEMRNRLNTMQATVDHLLEHIQQPIIHKAVLEEIHDHLDELDKLTSFFHQTVESVASKWRKRIMIETKVGEVIPLGLVVPVTIDCFCDGFLIGVSVGISINGGTILAAANCLEMSFLGMAYSARLIKCTGSSLLNRHLATYCPPFLMFLAAGLGAALASLSAAIPAIFVGFVAFGSVALLFLVCTELLIEANSVQGDEHKWWISILIFVGIYVVIISNCITF